jgi:hypothetical protein
MALPKRDEPVATFDEGDTVRPEWALSDERIPLFTSVRRRDDEGNPLDEPETITVTMPAKPNPSLALDFLRRARSATVGGELAISWLIEEAVGSDGYDELIAGLKRMPDPENGQAVMRAIGERVQRVVMGGLEGPKA